MASALTNAKHANPGSFISLRVKRVEVHGFKPRFPYFYLRREGLL